MKKCGDKFCSDPSIRIDSDVRNCVATKQANHPGWKGSCFYQREGKGCEECGGRVVRQSTCSHCIECGWSRCG